MMENKEVKVIRPKKSKKAKKDKVPKIPKIPKIPKLPKAKAPKKMVVTKLTVGDKMVERVQGWNQEFSVGDIFEIIDSANATEKVKSIKSSSGDRLHVRKFANTSIHYYAMPAIGANSEQIVTLEYLRKENEQNKKTKIPNSFLKFIA
ncbi:MAG: hypothetical protein ACJAS1_003660 [Oleiphilaceae bacterium]|jgi:hypothetical protein